MGLKRLLKRVSQKNPLDARQWELGKVPPVDLAAIVRAYLSGRSDFYFVQIGAHDGDSGDPIAHLARSLNLKGVLVEPQSAEFEKLTDAYSDQKQVALERAAIANEDGTAKLYKVNPEFWKSHNLPDGVMTQISSLNQEQIKAHVEMFGGRRLAERETEYLEFEDVPAITLPSLFEKHGIERCDLLQIDTEGFDYNVLQMVNWDNPPNLIHFETIHLSPENRIAAWGLVRSHGYSLYATNEYNTLAISGSA